MVVSIAILALVMAGGCGKSDLGDYSLGPEAYPNYPDCKRVLFRGKLVPGVFLKKINRASSSRLEGVACHDRTFVIDAQTGCMREGRVE